MDHMQKPPPMIKKVTHWMDQAALDDLSFLVGEWGINQAAVIRRALREARQQIERDKKDK